MDGDGYIPETSRAVMTLCDVDLKSKSMTLGCTSKGENGGKVFRSETLEWKFGIGNEKVLSLGEDNRYLARFMG